MSQVPKRPVGRQVQATVFRFVNVPMRALLGLPIPTPLGRRLMLVQTVGRKSGKHYRQPVSYVPDGESLLTPGGGRWTLNLRDGEPVQIRVRGRDRIVYPQLVGEPDEIERLLAVMTAANPSLRRFVRVPRDSAGRLDRQSLGAAIRHGFRVVRWEPHPPPG